VSFLFGSLSILLGNGTGAFKESTYYDVSYPAWVIAEDFSGDGKVDLAVTESPQLVPEVSIFKGNGDGTFQPPVSYLADIGYIASGDLNGDGRPDLVGVGGNPFYVTVLLNTGVVSFSPTTPVNFGGERVGGTSDAGTVILTNTGTTELKIQSIKASSEFAVKSTCGERVAAGASCTISATFSPTKQGAAQGTITIIDNASSKPQVIELLGTGT
jgi:hypothetical protein